MGVGLRACALREQARHRANHVPCLPLFGQLLSCKGHPPTRGPTKRTSTHMHPHANTRALSAAKAAIIHAARRDSPETETRRQDSDAPFQEPSAAAAEARREPSANAAETAASEARRDADVPARRGSQRPRPIISSDLKPGEKLGPRGKYGGVGWYQVLSKHGALVRSAATLDSELVCEVKEGSRLLVSSNCLSMHSVPKSETVAQVRRNRAPASGYF